MQIIVKEWLNNLRRLAVFSGKYLKVLVPLSVVAGLLLTSCANGTAEEEPKPTASQPSDQTSVVPTNPTGDDSSAKPQEPLPNEEDIVVTIQEEGESLQQGSLFWVENDYGIEPSKVLVPQEVKDSFENTETIPNALLAQINEANLKSVLQSPFSEDNTVEAMALFRSYGETWLTGDALETFQDDIESYEKGDESPEFFLRLYGLIPHAPVGGQKLEAGGVKVSIREHEDTWYAEIDSLRINGVTEADVPTVSASYNIKTWVPVVTAEGEDRWFTIPKSMELEFSPGFFPGDWLISNYKESSSK